MRLVQTTDYGQQDYPEGVRKAGRGREQTKPSPVISFQSRRICNTVGVHGRHSGMWLLPFKSAEEAASFVLPKTFYVDKSGLSEPRHLIF